MATVESWLECVRGGSEDETDRKPSLASFIKARSLRG